jgi:CRISPR-associated protein Cmr6
MVRPLYNGSDQLLHGVPRPYNTGLWYDKFCDRWDSNFENLVGTSPAESGKQKWIQTITECSYKDEDLREFYLRHYELIQNCSGIVQHFKLTSDFVTGLGREHPVENGFAWHHTLGSPYLPGSSVKGMVRAWASQWTDDETKDTDQIDRIFGKQDKVGTVIFMDALPICKVSLKADIMTPHYSPYYQSSLEDIGKNPPADWYSPTPIPFLVVAKGATFQFGIVPRNQGCEQCKMDCQTAKKWLTEALQWIGAGAKTAVGYGRFEPDLESENHLKLKIEKEKQLKEEEQKTQQALQGKSEIAKELIEQSINNKWEKDKDLFLKDEVVIHWFDKLESNPQPDAIGVFSKFITLHLKDQLKLYNNDKKSKIKPRQLNIIDRFLKLQCFIKK